MPGTSPGMTEFERPMPMEKGGWVYIMTNRPNGTLYVGVTSDLVKRVWQHREGVIDGFTKDNDLKRLVYFEFHDEIALAIQREKTMKHWSRAWKVNLILSTNPHWADLSEQIV
jgi:putative endonuclease